MSSSAGVYTPSQLLDITQLASNVFADDVMKADVTPYAEAAQVITKYQTARFTPLQESEKDRRIRMSWITFCEPTDQAHTDECAVDGDEAATDSQIVEITNEREIGFKVARNDFRTNEYTPEQIAAHQLAVAIKTSDEKLAQYSIARMAQYANDADNAFLRGYGTDDGFTEIPAAAWGPGLMSYLNMVKIKNRLGNVRLLSGDLFYETNWNAVMESLNSNGSGALRKLQALPIDHDLFNIDSTLGYKAMFMFNPNSVALATKTRYPRIPKEYGGKVNQTRYSIPSPTLAGVYYDVIYEMTCTNNTIVDAWKVIRRYEFLVNPTGCTAGRNGILGFKCVA